MPRAPRWPSVQGLRGRGDPVEEMLGSAGMVCIVAAAIAAGLKRLGRGIPVLDSYPRQALLAGFGIALWAATLLGGWGLPGAGTLGEARSGIAPAHPTRAPGSAEGSAAEDLSAPSTAPVPAPRASSASGAPEAPSAQATRPAAPGAGFPNSDDFYPGLARRVRAEGQVEVRACVDTDGRLSERPTVAQSSGSEDLDRAALRLAEAGSGHYRPALRNGRPVSSCFNFDVRFQMTRPSDEALRSRER